MMRKIIFLFIFLLLPAYAYAGGSGNDPHQAAVNFPPSFASYDDADIEGVGAILKHRISHTPFNLVASLIFLAAILHTFLSSKFLYYAHKWKAEHQKEIEAGRKSEHSTHLLSEIFHFLGEVEVIFGLWAVALSAAVVFFYNWHTFVNYVSGVNYTEAMFVVVIMALASSRPILKLSESIMSRIASVFNGTLAAWWLTIMTLGPILGSFITEPAAMTISAMLLAQKFYELQPNHKFNYFSIASFILIFSVGGTLTHFAAPPVLMVTAPWSWDLPSCLPPLVGRLSSVLSSPMPWFFLCLKKKFPAWKRNSR